MECITYSMNVIESICRTMGTHYSNGSYGEALSIARDLEREVVDIMGSNNAVHASCINNIGTSTQCNC